MWAWLTLILILPASVFFTDERLRGKWPGPVRLLLAVFTGGLLYFPLGRLTEGAFFIALLLGQAACLAETVWSKREVLLAELGMDVGFDMTWLPLYLCSEEVWSYAVYLAAIVVCLALAPNDKWRRVSDSLYTENQKRYWLISLIPCMVLLPEAMIFTAVVMEKTGGKISVLSSMLMTVSFLILYSIALLLQNQVAGRLAAKDLNEDLNRWQEESKDYMNTIRSQRHDFNLHLHAISGLIQSGETVKCRAYIQKLVKDAGEINDIMPVSDAVVGSMLYNMRSEARRRGSDITYHITYDMEDILCNGFECNKIIGNLLQNAIDALQTPEDKQYGIRLSIFKRRGNTVIVSENRFTGDPDWIARVFEPGYSTKKNHEGIGLTMVLRTAKRYGGRVYPEFEQDKIRFVVNIPNRMHLSREGEEHEDSHADFR